MGLIRLEDIVICVIIGICIANDFMFDGRHGVNAQPWKLKWILM